RLTVYSCTLRSSVLINPSKRNEFLNTDDLTVRGVPSLSDENSAITYSKFGSSGSVYVMVAPPFSFSTLIFISWAGFSLFSVKGSNDMSLHPHRPNTIEIAGINSNLFMIFLFVVLPTRILHEIFIDDKIQLPNWPKIIPQAKFLSMNKTLSVITLMGFLIHIPPGDGFSNLFWCCLPPSYIPQPMSL